MGSPRCTHLPEFQRYPSPHHRDFTIRNDRVQPVVLVGPGLEDGEHVRSAASLSDQDVTPVVCLEDVGNIRVEDPIAARNSPLSASGGDMTYTEKTKY